jgi:hypothetical protein
MSNLYTFIADARSNDFTKGVCPAKTYANVDSVCVSTCTPTSKPYQEPRYVEYVAQFVSEPCDDTPTPTAIAVMAKMQVPIKLMPVDEPM